MKNKRGININITMAININISIFVVFKFLNCLANSGDTALPADIPQLEHVNSVSFVFFLQFGHSNLILSKTFPYFTIYIIIFFFIVTIRAFI